MMMALGSTSVGCTRGSGPGAKCTLCVPTPGPHGPPPHLESGTRLASSSQATQKITWAPPQRALSPFIESSGKRERPSYQLLLLLEASHDGRKARSEQV